MASKVAVIQRLFGALGCEWKVVSNCLCFSCCVLLFTGGQGLFPLSYQAVLLLTHEYSLLCFSSFGTVLCQITILLRLSNVLDTWMQTALKVDTYFQGVIWIWEGITCSFSSRM